MYKYYEFYGFEYAKSASCAVMYIFGRLVYSKVGRQFCIMGRRIW